MSRILAELQAMNKRIRDDIGLRGKQLESWW